MPSFSFSMLPIRFFFSFPFFISVRHQFGPDFRLLFGLVTQNRGLCLCHIVLFSIHRGLLRTIWDYQSKAGLCIDSSSNIFPYVGSVSYLFRLVWCCPFGPVLSFLSFLYVYFLIGYYFRHPFGLFWCHRALFFIWHWFGAIGTSLYQSGRYIIDLDFFNFATSSFIPTWSFIFHWLTFWCWSFCCVIYILPWFSTFPSVHLSLLPSFSTIWSFISTRFFWRIGKTVTKSTGKMLFIPSWPIFTAWSFT